MCGANRNSTEVVPGICNSLQRSAIGPQQTLVAYNEFALIHRDCGHTKEKQEKRKQIRVKK